MYSEAVFGSRQHRGWFVLAGLFLVACGGGNENSKADASGVDISGMYQVSHHTTSVHDCVNEGTESTSVPFFRVLPQSKGYAAVRCTGADVSTCANDITQAALKLKLIAIVDHAETNGWTGVSSLALTSGGCTLSHSESSAILSGSSLRIEDRSYTDQPTDGACTQAEADRRGASMPCDEFDVFAGERQ